MSAPDDLERRRHHRQARPTSHWGKDDAAPHPGAVASCAKCNCPNHHGPDGVIACWSPGGPCPMPNDPTCETCGLCFHCTDRPDPTGGAA